VLQCLQSIVEAWRGRRCIVVCCNMMQCVVDCCSMLQCVGVFCSLLRKLDRGAGDSERQIFLVFHNLSDST